VTVERNGRVATNSMVPRTLETATVIYDYRDYDGQTLYRVGRFEPKDFRPFYLVGGRWMTGFATTDRVLYRIPELHQADPTAPVFFVEGEKDTDRLIAAGLVATTKCGGASQPWHDGYTEALRGRQVVVIPDNDAAGRRHAYKVADALRTAAVSVTLLDLCAGMVDKADVSDWLDSGHTVDELVALADSAPPWNGTARPGEKSEQRPAPGEQPWPAALAPQAFHGLTGDIIRAIEPYSEADPAALLAHVLTGVGAMLGAETYAVAGDARHPARLFALVVGETSKGRKGSAAQPIQRLLAMTDPAFKYPDHLGEGLSSGEGLVYQVRDAVMGTDKKGETVLIDPGVADKRFLVVESEFAGALRVMIRDGNTLSALVRRTWDTGDLAQLTKTARMKATGANITIIGHITGEELTRYLDRTEILNGFANRFLFVAARRGRILPDGEQVPPEVLAPLADRLREVVRWARVGRQLRRDAEAGELWRHVYESLSTGRPGILGHVTNRAEAQVLRLSVFYAILDQSPVIQAEHLLAGLAVWKYCAASAAWLFGDALGDPTADAILSALRHGERDRTAIADLLGRHVQRDRIDRALLLLLTHGRATFDRVKTGGRDQEVWHAI
jgi:hypothetical protein